MNPNSTNPYFANKVRSPDQQNRLGFGTKNELPRSPGGEGSSNSARGSETNQLANLAAEKIPKEKPKLQKVSEFFN